MAGSESTAEAFALDGVSHTWNDGTLALDRIDLVVRRGESVALLGGNGSGKTTLLRILDGLLFPTAGLVRAFGRPLDEAALRDESFTHRLRRRIAFVFQNADAQLFSSTVREELAFGPLHLGLDRDEVVRRVEDVAGMLGIAALMERHPFRLSGGEKRKVGLGSVLTIDPEAILLDEPTTGLDPRSQVTLIGLLTTLHGAGKTLVMATNDLELVPEVAARVVVIGEDHRIVADGPARAILRDTSLLLAANVIHEHSHWHGERLHAHDVPPGAAHDHRDESP